MNKEMHQSLQNKEQNDQKGSKNIISSKNKIMNKFMRLESIWKNSILWKIWNKRPRSSKMDKTKKTGKKCENRVKFIPKLILPSIKIEGQKKNL